MATPPRKSANRTATAEENIVVQNVGIHDVILGRGSPVTENPGNVHLRQIVVEKHPEYMQCKRQKEKHLVAVGIMEVVKQRGGRFLRKNVKSPQPTALPADASASSPAPFMESPAGWIVVTNEKEIIGKIKQLLRDMGPEAMARRLERRRYRYRKLGVQKTRKATGEQAQHEASDSSPSEEEEEAMPNLALTEAAASAQPSRTTEPSAVSGTNAAAASTGTAALPAATVPNYIPSATSLHPGTHFSFTESMNLSFDQQIQLELLQRQSLADQMRPLGAADLRYPAMAHFGYNPAASAAATTVNPNALTLQAQQQQFRQTHATTSDSMSANFPPSAVILPNLPNPYQSLVPGNQPTPQQQLSLRALLAPQQEAPFSISPQLLGFMPSGSQSDPRLSSLALQHNALSDNVSGLHGPFVGSSSIDPSLLLPLRMTQRVAAAASTVTELLPIPQSLGQFASRIRTTTSTNDNPQALFAEEQKQLAHSDDDTSSEEDE